MADLFKDIKEEIKTARHYYGDFVRFLFMAAAVIMLLTLPFLSSNIPVSVFISIIIILIIGIISGITNPLQKWSALLNLAISLSALFVFEYFAVRTYLEVSFHNLFFLTNQLLAIIFLFALYYSTKTLRAMLLKK